MAKKRIRDLKIKKAENGEEMPQGDEAVRQALDQANEASKYTDEERAQAPIDERIRLAKEKDEAEKKARDAEANKSQLDKAAKARPSNIADKALSALRILRGK